MGIRAQGNPIASFADLWSQTGTDAIPSPGKAPAGASGSPEGHEASGGIINDWLDPSPGKVYRTHIFINTGTFDVTALSGTYPANIEYLVVGGGGGGGMTRNGYTGGGGGGAGGFRTNLSGHPLEAPAYTIGTGVYNVVVGGGGNSGKGGAPQCDPGGPSNSQAAQNGGNSEFYPAPISYPNTSFIRGAGGGGGGNAADPSAPAGQPGGSGGGQTYYNPSPAGGTVITDPNHPLVAGYAGGAQAPTSSGGSISGGGGGAGAVGEDGRGTTAGPVSPTTSPYGAGGAGLQVALAGPPTASPIGVPGPSGNGWFAGGGGGGLYSAPTPDVPTYSPFPAGNGGAGGGGTGVTAGPGVFPAGGVAGTRSTGSGGGGGGTAGGAPAASMGGQGGSGIVAIRYQIGTTTSAPGAKATGGDISYNATNEQWIHTFTTSGTFATGPTWTAADVDYFIVGGGASGAGAGTGSYGGGGGGAGAVRIGTTPIAAHPVSTTIQVGAGGAASYHELLPAYTGLDGTPSYFGVPIAAAGGGGGGQPAGNGVAGGSGGGAGGTGTAQTGGTGSGDPYPGSPPDESPTNGWGNDGGDTPGAMNGGGGGGGASSAGSVGQPKGGGSGGSGIAIPTTFYSPTISTIGGTAPPTNPGEYWVAGGGGGSTYLPDSEGGGGGGGRAAATADEAGYAGGGQGEGSYNWPFQPNWTGRPLAVSQGWENTGGGGGGGGTGSWGYKGGSGLVIIAYPR